MKRIGPYITGWFIAVCIANTFAPTITFRQSMYGLTGTVIAFLIFNYKHLTNVKR